MKKEIALLSVRCNRKAFSLVELLVVIAVIAMLLAILVPSLQAAKLKAKAVACSANLSNIGKAIFAYAGDYKDTIPFGPEAPPITGSNFYTVKGDVTSLLSLENSAPVGLGLLLKGYLSQQPKVLFCPGADQRSEADKQLAKFWKGQQSQSDYYYRHASVALISGTPQEYHIRLSSLGKNRNGIAISALVTDVQFIAHKSLAAFGIVTRTSHRGKLSNVLYADSRVVSQDNADKKLTVDIGGYPYDSLEKILRAFEFADTLR
jgi:prepilin-type N-terminal cleavage/methylation domain-containing protein